MLPPCPPHNAAQSCSQISSPWPRQTNPILLPASSTTPFTPHSLRVREVTTDQATMALDTCFRAWALHAPGSKDRLLVGISSSSSSFVLSKRTAAPAVAPLSLGRVATRRPPLLCQSKNAVDEVVVADDKNWEGTVIACETPVLVEFWAPWCGPCRMIAPVIDELAKEYAGKIKCCKVNTDDCPNVASTYGIRSIPTVLIFKAGEKKESIIGAVPKTTLTTIIDKYIGS